MTATVRPVQARTKGWQSFFKSGRTDSPFKRILIHLTLIICCIIAVYPVLRVLSVSLRPGDRLLSTSLAIIPADATLDAYRTVVVDKDFLLWLFNSIVITAGTAVFGVTLAATSAYAFSRWRFIGRAPFLVFLLATQMIPATMMIVPIFVLATKLSLTETYRGLVIAYSVSAVPFSIWILKGYYDTIPGSLEEAATIDGASRMYTLWRIILPLAAPALAVVFLFNFMSSWNDFLLARIMLQKPAMYTWPLGLQSLQAQFATQWGAYAAASLLLAVPVASLFLYTSKWLISGLTLGSVKGD